MKESKTTEFSNAPKARKKLILELSSFKDPDYLFLMGKKIITSMFGISKDEKLLEARNAYINGIANYLDNLNKNLEDAQTKLKSSKDSKDMFKASDESYLSRQIVQLESSIKENTEKIEKEKAEATTLEKRIIERSKQKIKAEQELDIIVQEVRKDPQNLNFFIDNIIEEFETRKYEISYTLVFITELFLILTNPKEESESGRLLESMNFRFQNLKRIIAQNIHEFNLDSMMVTSSDDIDFDLLVFLTIRQTPEHEVIQLLEFQDSKLGNVFLLFLKTYFSKFSKCLNPIQCKIVNDWIELKSQNDKLKKLESPNNDVEKIEWLGSQKQLGELFVQLKRKGWIPSIPHRVIKASFTKSKTIHQVLKPTTDKYTKEDTYENIFSKAYKPKFDSIREK